jgi:hypothetical protein
MAQNSSNSSERGLKKADAATRHRVAQKGGQARAKQMRGES